MSTENQRKSNLQEKEQDYAKKTFDDVALRYDEIEFFKISARHIAKMIQQMPSRENLEILDVTCGSGNVVLESASVLKDADKDTKVELIADSFFVSVNGF